MRHLLFTIFITKNDASFLLWRKKNLVKHQKVSKYYDHNCKPCGRGDIKLVIYHMTSRDDVVRGSCSIMGGYLSFSVTTAQVLHSFFYKNNFTRTKALILAKN